jgi:hypothetical protein
VLRASSGWVAAVLVLCTAIPASAEFPVALRVSGGPALGSSRQDGEGGRGPLGGLAVGELVWRYRPGRAVVLSLETAGLLGNTMQPLARPGSRDPGSPRPRPTGHESVILGMEWSRPGAGVGPYLQGGLGPGRVGAKWASREEVRWGLALAGTAGLRIAPDPGPVGFLLCLHANCVVAHSAYCLVVGPALGITIRPR